MIATASFSVKMGQATINAKKTNAALALVVADPSDLDERVSVVGLHAVLPLKPRLRG